MALPLNLLGYAQIIINGRQVAGGGSSEPCMNVFYYRRPNQALPLTEAAVIAVFQAGPIVALAAAANIRWQASQILCRFVDDPSRLAVGVADASVGAIGTDSEPQQNTVTMKLQTANRKPRCIGQKRFGGVSEIDTTNDILVAGLARWQAVQAALVANLAADANGNTWTPYVLSAKYSNLKLLPQATIVAYPISAVILKKNVLTLRTRRSSNVV